MFYTGIGSRETPSGVLVTMQEIASELANRGYTLRSGGAKGADSAFEKGCISVNGSKQIYLPWNGFDGHYGIDYIVANNPKAEEVAASFHPAWDKCSKGTKKMHTRNVYQLLGTTLGAPSSIVICWTPGGQVVGGTGQAIRMATFFGITIINLFK